MLFNKTLFRFFYLFCFFSFTACTFYKTVNIDTGKEAISYNYNMGKMMLIHDTNESFHYLLTNVVIENDSLKGTVSNAPRGRKHTPHKKSFAKNVVTAYQPLSVMHVYTSLATISPGPIAIPISGIRSVEIHDKNYGASAAATAGIVIAATVVGGGIFLAIACNCPQVASYNENGTQFHGSLFPGAVFKSLQRDDYLILDNPGISEKGELNLRISNEEQETQYIDQLEVLEVEHPGYAHLGLNSENELVAFNEPIAPEQANVGARDVTKLLQQQDGINYDFNTFSDFDQLNELILKFDKSKFSDKPALMIHAQQTEWLDTVATVIFSQVSKARNEKWIQKNDHSSPQKWKNKNIDRGLSLNVYLKVNEKWEYVGTHHDAGTSSKRNLLMELDLTKVQSTFIEIKLESAFKIWEIDYAGLVDDWSDQLAATPLDIQTAETQHGKDIISEIHQADEQYLIREEMGSYVDLHLKVPTSTPGSSLVLHGNGYYHKHPQSDNKTNLSFYAKFYKKLGLQDISRAVYQYQFIQLPDTGSEISAGVGH